MKRKETNNLKLKGKDSKNLEREKNEEEREKLIKLLFQEIAKGSPGKRELLIKLFQEIAKASPDAKLTPDLLRRAVILKIREMLTGDKKTTMANVKVWQTGVEIATGFASDFEKMNGGKKHPLLHSLIVHFDNKMRHTWVHSKRPIKRQELSGKSGKKISYDVTIKTLRVEIGQCIKCGLAKSV